MHISIIVAVAGNGVIGRDGGLPWRLPGDLGRFKAVTMGKPIIMGRKTWSSIGRALPGRLNIVVTRNKTAAFKGATTVHSFEDALNVAAGSGAEEAMVIGGRAVFGRALDVADRVYLTEVHALVDGDALFPLQALKGWEETFRKRHESTGPNSPAYSFVDLKRPKN